MIIEQIPCLRKADHRQFKYKPGLSCKFPNYCQLLCWKPKMSQEQILSAEEKDAGAL